MITTTTTTTTDEIVPAAPWLGADAVAHVEVILASYRRHTGTDLIEGPDPVARAARLFEAPFFVLAQGTEPEPIYGYGNRLALTLFELDWTTLRQTPGYKSAEADGRSHRAQALETARLKGYIDDYGSVRVSSSGRRFRIEGVRLWHVADEHGVDRGLAAACERWSFL